MKKKQKEEIKLKNITELLAEIRKKSDEIFQARLDLKTGKLKNTSQIRRKNDELAVLKTIIKQKKSEGEQK